VPVGVRVDEVNVGSAVKPESGRTRAAAADHIGTVAVIGIAVAASLGLLPWLDKSMFADEGATLYSAHLSWSNLWAQSLHVDLVLLPYYVLVHFWSMISGDISFVRLLSVLAYFGTIVAAGVAGLRLAGRWCGIIAAVLTATSTLLVLKSLNARPYELSALLVTLAAIALFRWLEEPRPRWLWAFSVLSLLATAMQLFSLLAPFSMLLCVLLVRPKLLAQRIRDLLVPIAFLAVACGAWIVASIGEVGQVNWISGRSADGRLTSELRGPLIGVLYDFVLLVIAVVILAKLAAVWNRDVRRAVADRLSRDRDILAVTLGWTLLPTVVLSIASFIHPIYANRYVAASAPGAALLVAFICVRAFPAILDPRHSAGPTSNRRALNRVVGLFGVVAAVVLTIGYLNSAAALQEDLQSPARYAAQHVQNGDVIALPDHAITAAVDSYLAGEARPIPHWPQLGVRQRFVEGFDLSLHPAFSDSLPRRVWLVTDGSVPGIANFERVLDREGYVLSEDKQFTGVSLLLYDLSEAKLNAHNR
jgi:uncharacterized membrane protein